MVTLFLSLFAAALIRGEQSEVARQDWRVAAEETEQELLTIEEQLASVSAELTALQTKDQYVRNEQLQATISAIEETYTDAVGVYEQVLSLEDRGVEVEELHSGFAAVLSLLSKRSYSSASAELAVLSQRIQQEEVALATPAPAFESVTTSNQPPGSGFSQQRVETEVGSFVVSLVAADLHSTRVIVDTASEGDCGNDCPVLPLATYVSRNGAFAAINGSYFCPATYPSCAGKTNTFDTLLMNKDKKYFNSDNNVYSTVPAVVFAGSSANFVGQSLNVGRDTGVDAVLANHPLLVSGGQVVFTGDGDPKKGSKSSRGFVATKGSTVYIGHTHSATVAESGYALKALGMEYGLNLDGGGSSALWYGGYKVGPGRNVPNALLLVRR